ncbi:MAG: ABC transporter permease [Candidatus Latescibacter sp.]|nr:ABC transporter permease [Candidatus Latescibacter sp.]
MNKSFLVDVFIGVGKLLLAGISFLALWECVARLGIYDTIFFPQPTQWLRTLTLMIKSGELVSDIGLSLQRAIIGFLAGSALGMVVGLLTGRFRIFDYTFGQLIRLIRSIPSISLVPLVILWFGLGEFSKYFIVFWGVFFPVWINSHVGSSHVSQEVIWAARSLGARKINLLLQVILPSSFPFIMAGMRAGIAIAFVVLVAAEMTGAFGGLGYRIYASHLVFRVDKMVVGIATLGVIGAIADIVFAAALKAIPWQREDAKGSV